MLTLICLGHCRLTALAGDDGSNLPQPTTARSSHAAVALHQQLMVLGGVHKGALLTEFCIGDAANGVQVGTSQPTITVLVVNPVHDRASSFSLWLVNLLASLPGWHTCELLSAVQYVDCSLM